VDLGDGMEGRFNKLANSLSLGRSASTVELKNKMKNVLINM